MNSIKSICFGLFLIVFYLQSSAQLSDSIRANYFNASVPIVKFDQKVFEELKEVNELSANAFLNRSLNFFNEDKLNEASLFFIAGMTRDPLYHFMDPTYNENSDENEAFMSATAELTELILPYLNSNLHNYAAILHQYINWYRVNVPKKVQSTEGTQVYNEQLELLINLATLIEKNPDEYIMAIEDIDDNSNDDDYIIVNENSISHNQSSKIPQSFLVYDYGTPIVKNQDFELFAVAHGYYNTYLEGENVIIKQHHYNPMIYLVNPGNSDRFSISVYGENESGERAILGTYQFRTVDSLTPVVYIDEIRSGNKITSFDSIACTYYDKLFETGKLTIKSWELICEKKIVIGTGEQFSPLANSCIQKLDANTPFILNVLFIDSEKNEKMATGVFVK